MSNLITHNAVTFSKGLAVPVGGGPDFITPAIDTNGFTKLTTVFRSTWAATALTTGYKIFAEYGISLAGAVDPHALTTDILWLANEDELTPDLTQPAASGTNVVVVTGVTQPIEKLTQWLRWRVVNQDLTNKFTLDIFGDT